MRFNPKPKGRWKWLLIIGVPLMVLLIIAKMTNTNPPTHFAQTTPEAAAELRTRLYPQDAEWVGQAARAVAVEQKTWFRSWRIPSQQAATAATSPHDFVAEVPVLFFTDDIAVRIDTHEGQTRVNVESKSRVGQGDFGENRRHIAQFLRALDEALAAT